MFSSRFLRNFDWVLFAVMMFLACLGILVIYSTTIKATGPAGSDALKQAIFLLVGLGVFWFTAMLDYRIFRNWAWGLYGLSLVLLVLVKVLGKTALGATRWIDLGFFQLQPSELAKLALILVLAKYLSDHYDEMEHIKHLLISGLIMTVPLVLVFTQPDFGTAMVLFAIWVSMIVVTKAKKIYLLGGAFAGLLVSPVVYSLLKDYQKKRIETFLDPSGDPLGTGYNVVQSTIAVGSGRLFGRGLGFGPQSQLNFLPAQHTDFIFAVLAEKLGLVGSVILLGLFGVLIFRGVKIATLARDHFGSLLAVGITAMILFHVFINVGMNMGIAPVTGIPLPLLSYGGTSLIVTLIGLGILQSIITRHKTIEF